MTDPITPHSDRGDGNGDVTDVAGSLTRRVNSRDLALSVMELACAAALIVIVVLAPSRPADVLARVGGVLLVSASALRLIGSLTRNGRTMRTILASSAGLAVGIWLVLGGLAQLPFPELILEVVVTVALIVVAATGCVRVAARFGLTQFAPPRPDESRWLLVRWIDARSRLDQDRDAIQAEVFFEGDSAPTRIGRFALMMLFASVISAAGVVADSTAVVIGAMLIAPLITPMMGMGLALVSGWPNRLVRSTLLMLFGFAIATSTGWLLAAAVNFTVDLESNTQITSRSSPTAIDLQPAPQAPMHFHARTSRRRCPASPSRSRSSLRCPSSASPHRVATGNRRRARSSSSSPT